MPEAVEHKQATVSSKSKCQRFSCLKSRASTSFFSLGVWSHLTRCHRKMFHPSNHHKPLSDCWCLRCPWKRTNHHFHFQMSRRSVLIEDFSPDERFILETTPDRDWCQPQRLCAGLRGNKQFKSWTEERKKQFYTKYSRWAAQTGDSRGMWD